jgi:hypothetical protein
MDGTATHIGCMSDNRNIGRQARPDDLVAWSTGTAVATVSESPSRMCPIRDTARMAPRCTVERGSCRRSCHS